MPKLKVLVDLRLQDAIKNSLRNFHCQLYFEDLSKKSLTPQEILQKTDNPNGFDLTSNQGISLEIGNYEWMGYEIINEQADFVFVPFGTGIIFKKLLELNKIQQSSFGYTDPRFKGDLKALENCSYLGVYISLEDLNAELRVNGQLPAFLQPSLR